jgi:alkyldihydroxyacetonephosphate synthase
MQDLAASEHSASVTRVSDAHETQFSFAMRVDPTLLDKLQSRLVRTYLDRRRGFDVDQMCLAFIGYEGTERHVSAERRAVGKLVKHHGGVCIGSGPGVLYDQKKFDIPYIRDFLLDRGAPGDVSETATTWTDLLPLYDAVISAAHGAFDQLAVQGYVMCHLSHSYHAGACLYFTFAFKASSDNEMLAEYEVVKSAIQQAFVDNGGTLSHHHAVGTEHAQWLEEDISAPGVAMLTALFEGTDPGKHLNPGKIV